VEVNAQDPLDLLLLFYIKFKVSTLVPHCCGCLTSYRSVVLSCRATVCFWLKSLSISRS